MKKVYRQKPVPVQAPKKHRARAARAVKPKRIGPIENGSHPATLGVIPPFVPVWQISEQEREKIRKELVSGLKEMNDLYLEESKAWHPLEEEVYEKSIRNARPRRHHPSRPRSRKRA